MKNKYLAIYLLKILELGILVYVNVNIKPVL